MQAANTINRRTFIALGATAATGLAKAQSLVVKRRIKKGECDPLRDVVKPALASRGGLQGRHARLGRQNSVMKESQDA